MANNHDRSLINLGPTGKSRYRSNLFGKLIVQIECRVLDEKIRQGCTLLVWRDAKVKDFHLTSRALNENTL